MSIDKLRQQQVQIRWVHFPLHPETPPEGLRLKDLYKNRPEEDVRAAGDHLRKLMAEAGLPYGKRTMTYNTRLAQELGCWADSLTGADPHPVHDALFRACFVHNQNINDVDTLISIAESSGLDGAEARRVLTHRLFSPQVNNDWQRAWASGVTGVPTFSSRDLYVVGCQPYEVLERFLQHLRTLAEPD